MLAAARSGKALGRPEDPIWHTPQVLDHALALRVGRFAEVGSETVVGGEAQVVGMRHDQPGDRSGAQTPHAVGEKHRRDAADLLQTLGQESKGVSRRSLVAKRTKR